jgi:hypothetical protein
MNYSETQITNAAAVVERNGNDFSFGKPDERDFIRMVLRGAELPELGNGDPVLERIADELYEDMGETVQSPEEMARFVLTRLPEESATREP